MNLVQKEKTKNPPDIAKFREVPLTAVIDDLFSAGCCYKRGTGFCCLATLVLGCVVLVLGVVLLISGRVRQF